MKRMAGLRKKPNNEWVGGLVSMPAYVTGEGEPYRPDMLLWVDGRGLVLGTTVGKPGEVLGKASDHLQQTIQRPMIGPAGAPDRLRVASPEIAAVLRAGHPSIEIVTGPTPELDSILAGLREQMQGPEDGALSWLLEDCHPETAAWFFRATAACYRSKPWKLVPGDDVVAVTVDKYGLHEGALTVIGQMGQHFGFLLFSSLADFDAFVEAAEAIEDGDNPPLPSHLALNFERGADVDARVRKRVSAKGWEIASPKAYPWLAALDKDMVARPPTEKEVAMVGAIAEALAMMTDDKAAVRNAFAGGEVWSRTYAVTTSEGEIAVALRVPHERDAAVSDDADDVLAALAEMERDGQLGEDPERRAELENALSRAFMASPEAVAVSELEAFQLLMSYAADYVGASIATLKPAGLREVVFEVMPRKWSVEAEAAAAIIEDCRAFYRFLKRAFALPQADACLRVFAPPAEKQLAKALSDPRNFGMAKSIFMAGQQAGFDIHSKEGVEGWMREIQGKPLPSSIRLPGLDGMRLPQHRDRNKKNKRKAARKARKRNR